MKSVLSQGANDLSFLILYGSQLGQAKSIAEGLGEVTASDHNLKTLVFPLNDIKNIADIPKISCPIVIITSTTGDGEPPENADKFFRKLRRKALSSETLHSVRYTILGLGDTNYNTFCNCGKTVHQRFQELGATLFYPPAWADDAVGLDDTVDSWIEGLWPAINSTLGIGYIEPSTSSDYIIKILPKSGSGDTQEEMAAQELVLTLPNCPSLNLNISYTDESPNSSVNFLEPTLPYPQIDGVPFTGTVSNARLLSKGKSVKTTLEITVQLDSQTKNPFDFEPGDAIGIICPNSEFEVDTLLQKLGATDKSNKLITVSVTPGSKGKTPAYLPSSGAITLRNAFLHYIDIRTPPKKAFLRLLAENTAAESEKNILLELCSKQGATKYEETVRIPSLSILDILIKYPSCKPSVEALLEHCPRLIPRAYSISSSPLTSKDAFTLAFNVISIPEEDGRAYGRLGVCTGWLYQVVTQKKLLQDVSVESDENGLIESLKNVSLSDDKNVVTDQIIFYKRKNHNFRLPTDLLAPVIMVGPGTGVAPFIGFAEHRQNQKQNGTAIGPLELYFGCRQKAFDYIYQETMEALIKDGILSGLNVSFSRDPDQTGIKYVQDLLEKNQDAIVSTLLDNGGYLYVCGDAKNMAKNVRERLIKCIQNVKGITEKEAMEQVTNLVSSKRYLQDVWS